MSLSDIRREYLGEPLDESHSDPDPLQQFARWYAQAAPLEADPTAMTLATATPDGRPSARIVLLKGVDDRGFVFYTNYDSRKGRELAESPYASLVFYWASVNRQVRINGLVEKVSEAESDKYFASRPFESRIAATISPQSEVLAGRAALDALYAAGIDQHPDGTVSRPSFWGGYRVVPTEIEFWQGRANRLHDRLVYRKQGTAWLRERLAP